MELVAPKPGRLPDDGDPIVAGVALPSGRRLHAGSTAVAWISDAELADPQIWSRLASRFAEHGLWPLVLESFEQGSPWSSDELDPSASAHPETFDAEQVLSDWWEEVIPGEGEEPEAFDALAPFSRSFPGLASATMGIRDHRVLAAIAAQIRGRLGLVAVTRPADALAVIGWQGPVNHFSDMGRLSAVLRSWERRFGAYLVGVGFDTITLAVERPPTSAAEATAIAAEHLAICADCIFQGSGSIEAHAASLVGQHAWRFWWD